MLFGAVCLGVFALGMLAPTPPRLAQLGFLVVAGFLLVNKVYSPQYVLWLLPLAVLARPRWRDLLIWQAGELFYYVAIWLNLGGWLAGVDRRLPGDLPAAASLVHLAGRAVPRRGRRPRRAAARARPRLEAAAAQRDLDPVDVGGGEAHPDVDLVADVRHR